MEINLIEGGGKVRLAQPDDPPPVWTVRANYHLERGSPAPTSLSITFENGEAQPVTTTAQTFSGGGPYAVLEWGTGDAKVFYVHYELPLLVYLNLWHVAVGQESNQTVTWVQIHVPPEVLLGKSWELNADLIHGKDTHAEVELRQFSDSEPNVRLQLGANHFISKSQVALFAIKNLTGPGVVTIIYSVRLIE